MHTLLDVVEFITIIIDVIVIPLSLVLALYLLVARFNQFERI